MSILHEFKKYPVSVKTITPIMYKSDYVTSIITTLLLFTLYGILGLFEMNKYIHSVTIAELPTLTRGSFIYAYVFGYVILIIRIMTNLLTLFIFITIILVSFSTVWYLVKEDEKKKWNDGIIDIIWTIALYVIGIICNFHFYAIFFIYIPFFLIIILTIYTKFIDFKNFKLESENDKMKLMTTHHKLFIFMIIVLFFLGIGGFIFNWVIFY
jgi:hypothetical protein